MLLDGEATPLNNIINADHPRSKPKSLDNQNLSRYFFYTIAVNHSHYALNSHHVGDWINSLFHKNDGYTAPIVINPMRTEGNFNINSEINFARYRLLANKLHEWNIADHNDKIFVSDDKFISRVIFKLNRNKIEAIPKHVSFSNNEMTAPLRERNLLIAFLANYLNLRQQKQLMTVEFDFKDIICNYIINKIDSIPIKYPWFGTGYQFSEETPFIQNDKFFKDLLDDGSHITYKLKQAVYFLIYCLETKGEGMFSVKKSQLQGKYGISFTYALDEIFKWSNGSAKSNIMTRLPPSIFDIDFELSDSNKHLSKFTDLSSGEQQMIHTLQSVVYHINNLQSAHSGRGKRSKYSAINIIYDEIELYFHPEYQRRFIDRLLRELKGLYQRERTHITSINILLLTHSPFILSDLPNENILLLEPSPKTGRAIPKIPASQTFAANINDLLADGFFITGTLMGEFAENKIKDAINRIKNGAMTNDDSALLQNIGDSFLKASLDNFKNRNHD